MLGDNHDQFIRGRQNELHSKFMTPNPISSKMKQQYTPGGKYQEYGAALNSNTTGKNAPYFHERNAAANKGVGSKRSTLV